MITGDNPLTGSNVAYKCEIAELGKKMVICEWDKERKRFKI